MALPTPPTATEVLATINSVPARKRLYAPSGSATIDNTFVDEIIAEVWSEAQALTRARHAPAEHLAGEVVRMRARHTLYFSGTSGPCKVLAGREFDASHEELMRAELVEGRDFERVTG